MNVIILTWILSSIFMPIRAPVPPSAIGYPLKRSLNQRNVRRIGTTSLSPPKFSAFTNPSTIPKLEQSRTDKTKDDDDNTLIFTSPESVFAKPSTLPDSKFSRTVSSSSSSSSSSSTSSSNDQNKLQSNAFGTQPPNKSQSAKDDKPTTKPEQDMSVSSDESEDKTDNVSKPEEATSQFPDKDLENSPSEDEWEGPKTPEEDKPELYTVDENVKFVREFTSDMTIQGKYKVGETIYYLLTKKYKELDTADKAALEYVINERLKKDAELSEIFKKTNEQDQEESESNQQSNSGQDSDEGIPMPSYMREILSPSFNISQFEPPPPQTSINTSNRPFPSNTQIFAGRLPSFSWPNTAFSPLPAHFPRPRFQSLFQDFFQDTRNPNPSEPRLPNLFQALFSNTGDILASPVSNSNSNSNYGQPRPRSRFPGLFSDTSETQSTNPTSNSNIRQPSNQGTSNLGQNADESRLPARMRSGTSRFPSSFQSMPLITGGSMFGDERPRMPNSEFPRPSQIPSFPPSITLRRFPRRLSLF